MAVKKLDANLKIKGESFYNYIDEIPTYIHNTEKNFLITAQDLYRELNPKSIEATDYMFKIINLQRAREDDILEQLFGTKDCDIMEKFVEVGFILSDEKTQKIISKIDELKYSKRKEAWEKEVKNNNLSPEEAIKKLESIWKEYREKINNIENNLDALLKELEIEGTISSSFISTKEILDGWLKEYKWPKKMTVQEGMIEELRRTDGVISNIYKTITEGYNKKNEAAIKTEIKERKNGYNFALLKEADDYRSSDKNLNRLAKSDQILIKLEGDIIIPIGGITVKKSSTGKPKVHDTTSIQAFLDYIRETDYILENEKKQDINRLTYLFGNRVVYGAKDFASEDLEYIIKKYGLIFFAGKIANEILNKEISTGVKSLKTNDIINKEHADFLYITTDKGGAIKRASEELEEIFKKGLSVGVAIDASKKSKILTNISEIKKKYSPYTYNIIVKNDSFKNEMNDFYNTHIDKNTKIRLDSKGVLI